MLANGSEIHQRQLEEPDNYSSVSGTSCKKRFLSPSEVDVRLEMVLVLLLLLRVMTARTSSGLGTAEWEETRGR